jgi:putative FmdB family regulatory protein
MPIYEYKCRKCGKEFEITQKFSDKPLTRCPSCAGRLSKLISNCSFQLKGSGWYVTDYKKKDSGGKASMPKKVDTPKNATPKADSTESKAEAKKE